jgi:hypothetical protein
MIPEFYNIYYRTINMEKIFNSNRRNTTRFPVEIFAKISILSKYNAVIIQKEVEIINISFEGIKIFFKDNELMNIFLEYRKNKDFKIKIDFNYEEENYSFEFFVKWVKIIDNAEKNFLIFSGLCFIDNNPENKEKKIDILVSLHMDKIYLGNAV